MLAAATLADRTALPISKNRLATHRTSTATVAPRDPGQRATVGKHNQEQVVHEFKAFYNDSPFGVFRADAAGRATYANPACSEITGREEDELLGQGWVGAIHSAEREAVLQRWRAACSADRSLDTTFRLMRPDGSRRFMRLRSRPLLEEGAAKEYVAVLIDLTDQVLAERRLRRNNALLSAVLENIPCGITVYDAEGKLILDNQEVRALLSLPDHRPDDAITDCETMAIDFRPSGPGFPESGKPWPTGADVQVEPRIRDEVQPDGRVLEVRDAPMPAGGLVTTYTDVTQQNQYIDTLQQAKAAAEQAVAAKAAFLATMSHEIRTPMNGVMGMTNILLETRLTPDQRELVDVIRQSGESLLVVINDILDSSRIESGQMQFEWLPLRLQEVVDNSLLLLSPKAREKGVSLAVHVDPGIPALILGDRMRLQQVFVNLLSNAVKFTHQGQVKVALAVAPTESPRAAQCTGDLCELEVCIEDTGIGIPADKLETIFEPFVQADSSTARRFGGTGLGLAIAKRLVQAMGGSISLQSEPGRGTKVCFTFIAEAAVPKTRATADHHLPLWRKRVLLVTGARADVGVLQTHLRRWGMEVELCPGASEARARLAKGNESDLVLGAAHMRDARWFEFVRSLRDCGISLPAVLLSRTRTSTLVDDALGARIVARASTEATLYDALADALQAGEGPGFAQTQANPQFDDSLGQVAPLRILVAEDNEINRKVVLRMLAGFGYQADIAQNGAEVIESVKQRTYDLVLMDVQMPQVDGIEATRFIVKNLPPARRPRVVAMSANVMREDVEAALAAGADHYIAKPFPPSELRAALQESAQRNPGAKPDTNGSAAQLLAPDRVRCHLEGDPTGQFLKELGLDFAQCSGDLERRLRAALRAQDVAQVRAIGHEYAGMCAVVGAEKLTQVLMELQKITRAGSLKGATLLAQQCVQVREQTIAALNAAVRQQSGIVLEKT
jgi:PAS domain S-box-containing protein